jgi:hypothetical protein
MTTPLLLENNQAPGDILMMTCAVRDLHKHYPAQFSTGIVTKCPDIWRNNPLVIQADRSKKLTHLRLGYTTSIQQSNNRFAHFSTGFVQDLSEKLGVRIRLTDMRPDLYLSDDEQDPAITGITGPYWVVLAGGKADFTNKIWDPALYQRVVDLLPDVKVVQAGAAGHRHTALKRVVNMVGKTTLRQFMLLIRHSSGVICPITCAMHFAAAFNKPCIVIAGGREPWWWEAYTASTWAVNIPNTVVPVSFMPHAYCHTIGLMDCCKQGGCWRNGVSDMKVKARNCHMPSKGPTIAQPSCMLKIKPELIASIVQLYNSGKIPPDQPVPEYLRPPLFTEELKVPAKHITYTAPRPTSPLTRFRGGEGRLNRKRYRIRCTGPITPPVAVPAATPARISSLPSGVRPYTGDLPGLQRFTVCILFYGDYPALTKRALSSLYKTVDPKLFELRIGMNAVSAATKEVVNSFTRRYTNITVYSSDVNLFKYPMMRKMFYDKPITTKYVMWLDDDSHFVASDWLPKLDAFVQANTKAKVIGRKYFIGLNSGQVRWIQQASWYRNKPLPCCKTTPVSHFVTGGWWIAEVKLIREANWPDPRLQNNGGDTNFGACCHQLGVDLYQHYYGIRISDHPRRGVSQRHPEAK